MNKLRFTVNNASVSALLLVIATMWLQSDPNANIAVHYILYTILFLLCCFRVSLGIVNKENEHIWSYNSISFVFFIFVFFGIISPIQGTSTITKADVPFTLMVLLLYILILIQFPNYLFDFTKIKDLQNNFLVVLLVGGFIVFQFAARFFKDNISLTTLQTGFIATFLSKSTLHMLLILVMLLILAYLYKQPALTSWELLVPIAVIVSFPLTFILSPISNQSLEFVWLFFYVVLCYVITTPIKLEAKYISLLSAISALALVLIYYKKHEASIYEAVTMIFNSLGTIESYTNWIIIVGTIITFMVPLIRYVRRHP